MRLQLLLAALLATTYALPVPSASSLAQDEQQRSPELAADGKTPEATAVRLVRRGIVQSMIAKGPMMGAGPMKGGGSIFSNSPVKPMMATGPMMGKGGPSFSHAPMKPVMATGPMTGKGRPSMFPLPPRPVLFAPKFGPGFEALERKRMPGTAVTASNLARLDPQDPQSARLLNGRFGEPKPTKPPFGPITLWQPIRLAASPMKEPIRTGRPLTEGNLGSLQHLYAKSGKPNPKQAFSDWVKAIPSNSGSKSTPPLPPNQPPKPLTPPNLARLGEEFARMGRPEYPKQAFDKWLQTANGYKHRPRPMDHKASWYAQYPKDPSKGAAKGPNGNPLKPTTPNSDSSSSTKSLPSNPGGGTRSPLAGRLGQGQNQPYGRSKSAPGRLITLSHDPPGSVSSSSIGTPPKVPSLPSSFSWSSALRPAPVRPAPVSSSSIGTPPKVPSLPSSFSWSSALKPASVSSSSIGTPPQVPSLPSSFSWGQALRPPSASSWSIGTPPQVPSLPSSFSWGSSLRPGSASSSKIGTPPKVPSLPSSFSWSSALRPGSVSSSKIGTPPSVPSLPSSFSWGSVAGAPHSPSTVLRPGSVSSSSIGTPPKVPSLPSSFSWGSSLRPGSVSSSKIGTPPKVPSLPSSFSWGSLAESDRSIPLLPSSFTWGSRPLFRGQPRTPSSGTPWWEEKKTEKYKTVLEENDPTNFLVKMKPKTYRDPKSQKKPIAEKWVK